MECGGAVWLIGVMENTMMKRTIRLFLAILTAFLVSGCGGSQDPSGKDEAAEASAYEDALAVLDAVKGAYGEDELFAMYGGNQDAAVMDAPGKFDINSTEELQFTLGLPESQCANIDDAASMVHMMNGNIFTGAAYHLKDGVNRNDFADAVKTEILDRQWICGQPDTLLIIQVDASYVITAYGEAEMMETFRDKALSVLDGAEMIAETAIG